MNKHIALTVAALVVATVTTTGVHAASSVQVKVENKCGNPAPYVIQKKGISLNTSLSPRASTTHALDVGDRIMVGKSVVHTVSAASAKQAVIVCNR
jgi:hypothetical protein